jgi:hypothetical protein
MVGRPLIMAVFARQAAGKSLVPLASDLPISIVSFSNAFRIFQVLSSAGPI